MNKEEENYQKQLRGWYLNTRKEYLKNLLTQTEAKNKYILLGTGGGILSILKFADIFKDNKHIQGICWILMGLFFLLAVTTLFSYVYETKSAETFIDLIKEYYLGKTNDTNFAEKNYYYKISKRIEKFIIILLSIITILVMVFFITAFYIKFYKI